MGSKPRIRTRRFPFLGPVKIWLNHDRKMGSCTFMWGKDWFTTPNMPKLRYAFDETAFLKTGELQVKKEVLGQNYVVMEKLDGFNLIFWDLQFKNSTVLFPKTRMLPYARGTISRVISHPDFPRDSVRRFMERFWEYYPVFEVYGRILDDLDILHGAVKYTKDTPYLKLALIGAIKKKTLSLSQLYWFAFARTYIEEEFGFQVPYERIIWRATEEDVLAIEDYYRKYNEIKGYTAKEGAVISSFWSPQFSMWKIKPKPVMRRDLNKGLTDEMILQQLEKILLEDVLYTAKNLDETEEQIVEYLKEEIPRISKSQRKYIRVVAAKKLATELVRKGYNTPEKMGRAGIDGLVIGMFIEQQR